MTEFPKYLLRISLFECPVKWKSGSLSSYIGKCKKTIGLQWFYTRKLAMENTIEQWKMRKKYKQIINFYKVRIDCFGYFIKRLVGETRRQRKWFSIYKTWRPSDQYIK